MSTMRKDDVFSIVVKHLVETLETIDADSIKPEQSMVDLGASSLDIVEVVSCSMRELRVRVPRDELNGLENIGQLCDLLHRVHSEKTN